VTRRDIRVNFPLRLPAELRTKLERAARESHRSINGEIVFRLERSIREESREYEDASRPYRRNSADGR
jgi:hypothetical protein